MCALHARSTGAYKHIVPPALKEGFTDPNAYI